MKDIEDIYPLSPLQESLLLHILAAPESRVGFEQTTFSLSGGLRVPEMERAWQWAVDRHAILRTLFLAQAARKPLQVVRRSVDLEIERQDWSALAPAEQAERLRAVLRESEARGFDPAVAPLMRLALIRLSADTWQLVWSYSHLLLDGWGRMMLLAEVFAAYQAFCRGEEPSLGPSRPFSEYIRWLQKQDRAAAGAFWRDLLAGAGEPTPLRLDLLPRGGEGGDFMERVLTEEATRDLESFGRRHRLTLNTLVQGAWALLLSRYSGREDVLFGATVSGRPTDLPGVESILGVFINNLPVRVRVVPGARPADWLQELQGRLATLRMFEFCSPSEIQEWSGIPPGQRLFETLVLFQNYPLGQVGRETASSGLAIQDYQFRLETGYPVTLVVGPGSQLLLRLYVHRERVDGAAARQMLDHVTNLLAGLAAEAAPSLAAVPLLGAEELRRSVVTGPQAPAATAATADELFAAQVRRRPEALAILAGEESLTREELARRAGEVAARLRELGGAPGDRVAVRLEGSAAGAGALLGALAAGAACVPVSPAWPADVLDAVLRTERIAFAVGLSPQVPWEIVRTGVPAAPGTPGTALVACPPEPSGDRPQGLEIGHGELVALLGSLAEQLRIGEGDLLAIAPPLPPDVAALALLLPLLSGGGLACGAAEAEAGLLWAAPSRLLERLRSGALVPPRRLVAVGESLTQGLAEALRAGASSLWHLFGGWRTGGVFCLRPLPPDATAPAIAGPLAGARLHLLDAALQPVPAGVPGILYVEDQATSGEALVRTPFRGYLLAGGGIGLLGETGSERHLLRGEAEAVLRGHPAVLEATVVLREDGPEPQTWAYVASDPGTPEVLDELRARLRRSLPPAALPAGILLLDSLPASPVTGEIDPAALPAPGEMTDVARQSGRPPRTAAELRLVRIWEDLFGIRPIGIRDSFFELGGHSLLAVRLMHEIRQRLGCELPLSTLLRAPTVELLARVLAESSDAPWSPLVELRTGGSKPAFFCVHAAGGSVLSYADLADLLGAERPFYGLQACGQEEGQEPLRRLEEIAALYVEAIRGVQPRGPYHLGGWSFGGLVAYEMARQLSAAGDEIGLLALLDAGAGHRAWGDPGEMDHAELLAAFLRWLLPLSVDDLRRQGGPEEQEIYAVRQLQREGVFPPDMDLARGRRLLEVYKAHAEASRHYTFRPFPGRITLLRSRDGLAAAGVAEPSLGWEGLAEQGLAIREVTGPHKDLVRRPHVEKLAHVLRECLEEAGAAHPLPR